MVWAYVDYGAEDLVTLEANRSAFDRYRFKSRVLTGHEPSDLARAVAGQDLSLPVLLAPTGLAGLSHWTGEVGAAKAAEMRGTLAIVSSASSYSFEEVAAATERDHFFQLYPWVDRATGRHDLTLSLIRRARSAGYAAMFVTVDVPVYGNRESEVKRGMGMPPVLTPRGALNAARHPRWSAGLLRHRRISLRNLVESTGARAAMTSLSTQYRLVRPELNWNDFAWMRQNWEGPLYIKGVLDAEDAVHAVELGADGVVVSNHGGRQLDSTPAALDALPAIVDSVGGRAQVLLDGGIRRGSDIVKALCLGADAVCIGRPYLYGLAVDGPQGAANVLDILHAEVIRCLTLMGVQELSDLDPSWLLPADQPVPAYEEA
jgi:L-lactate dehydrogenase (cytochrome)/(S)-mandelate dehydrogenase